MKTRSMYKAEGTSINRLPDPVLETILCLLPTKEAARTSILSREWRYKWTHIPKLRFELRNTTSELTSHMDMYDVYRVLLLHQGPIHELTLYLDHYWQHYDAFECDQIILHLLMNHTVKRLTLFGLYESEDIWYKLPKSVFALHHLTNLHLCTFDIDHPSIFNGFPSLQKLVLSYVKISTKTLLLLLSNCPSLKTLNLHIDDYEHDDNCTINELLKCLPLIEHLTISGDVSEWLVQDSVPQELSTLIHLKYLCSNQYCLSGDYGSAILLDLIKCSPNLEHAYLEMEYLLEFSVVKDKYSDVWLAHLNTLDLCFCSNSLEIEFVKFMLARSPELKKVSILTVVDRKRDAKMLKTLLRAPRASPGVKIYTWK